MEGLSSVIVKKITEKKNVGQKGKLGEKGSIYEWGKRVKGKRQNREKISETIRKEKLSLTTHCS